METQGESTRLFLRYVCTKCDDATEAEEDSERYRLRLCKKCYDGSEQPDERE